MKIDELKIKGEICSQDKIIFRTHAEVISLFGKNSKLIQRAYIAHPNEENVRIWFPMFYDDSNNEWDNTSTKDYANVFERRKKNNEEYFNDQLATSDHPIRLLFAKFNTGKVSYKFIGVYEFDRDLSIKAKKTAYRRVSNKAKLYPA